MARDYSNITWHNLLYETAGPPDYSWSVGSENPVGYTLKQMTRSDVVKNVKDLSGWRGASPYNVTVTDSVPYTGDLQIDTFNQGTTGAVLQERYSGCMQGYTPWGALPSFTSADFSLPTANATNRAQVECLLKVRNQSINLAVTFAERQKTIAMIADRTTRIFRAYTQAKRGKFRNAAKALGITKDGKQNASSWLELQYGWLPLLSDIYGGYKALTGRRAKTGTLFKVSRTITSDTARTAKVTTSTSTKIHNFSTKRQTKVVLWYAVNYEALAEASSLGLLNPLEVAWELTPFSFIVDWMVPVGNVLGALSATSGVTFKSGTLTKTVRAHCNSQVIPKNSGSGGNVIKRSGGAVGTIDFFQMQRTVYLGTPIPLPYVKNPLSTVHALNALALLRKLF